MTMTEYFDAASRGDAYSLAPLVERFRQKYSSAGLTALHVACMSDSLDVVILLLRFEFGCLTRQPLTRRILDKTVFIESGCNCLHLAIAFNS